MAYMCRKFYPLPYLICGKKMSLEPEENEDEDANPLEDEKEILEDRLDSIEDEEDHLTTEEVYEELGFDEHL